MEQKVPKDLIDDPLQSQPLRFPAGPKLAQAIRVGARVLAPQGQTRVAQAATYYEGLRHPRPESTHQTAVPGESPVKGGRRKEPPGED